MPQNDSQNGYELDPVCIQQTPKTETTQIDPPDPGAPPVAQSWQAPFHIANVTPEQKDNYPRTYRGYHAFSKWMAADRDFYVLRQFSESSVRVALFMQYEITYWEEQLRFADEWCMKGRMKNGEPMDNGTFHFDPHVKRQREILPKLAQCIRDYHQFIINQRLLQQSGSAAEFQIQNVKNWLDGAHQPIWREEVAFLDKERDLIPVLASAPTPIRRFLEQFKFVHKLLPMQRNVQTESFATGDFERQTTHPTNCSHLDRFVFCAIILIGIGMLVGPLWWLNSLAVHGPNLAPRLCVITGFLIAFVLLLCSMTIARPFEVLAATAAYGAVLMVFMQLPQPQLN